MATIPKNTPVVYKGIHFFNANTNAHLAAHVLIGFTFAHLCTWFYWLYVLFALVMLISVKEFFIDAYLYKHPFDTQVYDVLQYICGFMGYVLFVYLAKVYHGQVMFF
jgi:hypothetical protein